MQTLNNLALVSVMTNKPLQISRLELHDVTCRDLQTADTRTIETKRKADDVHDRIRTGRDRRRRTTKKFETTEEDLNDSPGRMGQLIKEPARATHALSHDGPDRESNEIRYLRSI